MDVSKRRLLVTGASGLLGWNVAALAETAGWQVTGTRRSPRPSHAQATWRWLDVDLTRWSAQQDSIGATDAGAALELNDFFGVIHCAAQANAGQCENEPAASRRINVDAAVQLATSAAKSGTRFIQVSTDLVFDGRQAPYAEDATPSPLSEYGRQKAEAERRVLSAGGMVCRLPLLLGTAAEGPAGALEWLLTAMQDGGAHLFMDEYRSPLSAATAASGLLIALAAGQGVWHLAGERMSRFEIGKQVAAAWGLGGAKLHATRQSDVATATARPKDVTMTAALAATAGFDSPPFVEQMTAARNSWLTPRD